MDTTGDMTAKQIVDAIEDAGFDVGISRYGHLIWDRDLPAHLVEALWNHEGEVAAYILDEAPLGIAAEGAQVAAERRAARRARFQVIEGGQDQDAPTV